MGYRQAAVLSSSCFLLGILFVCFNVDHRLLFAELTDEGIADGFRFYETFYNAPPAIKTLLYTMVGMGILGLLGKLHRWDESAMFFDGSSLVGYIFMVGMYASVTVPTLRTIVDPVKDVDTYEDQVQAMRVLAAGNTINIVILGAVLVMQAGDEYARRYEARELAKIEAAEAAMKAQTPAPAPGATTESSATGNTTTTPQEKKAQ